MGLEKFASSSAIFIPQGSELAGFNPHNAKNWQHFYLADRLSSAALHYDSPRGTVT